MQHFLKSPIDNIHKVFTAFLLIMVLAGCGFHLRGNYNLPTIMQDLCITPDEPLQPLQKNIRRILQHNNVTIHSHPSDKLPTLHLGKQVFSEQILATTADDQNQRIRITMTFNYNVTLGDKILRKLTEIQVSRDISINPAVPLASENEQRTINAELLKEGINQLLRQLTTITVEHDANHS